jgi:Domain of unknown function (DUF4920)
MTSVLAAALLALTMPVGAATDETKLGAGVTLKEATPIASLVAKPADHVGRTVRIDGVATAVCSAMGCWMAVAPESDPKGQTVRLKVEDGVIVFPMTAKGKKVSAEGVFEAVGDAHGERLRPERGAEPPSESERGWGPASTNKEAAGEHAKEDAKASVTYQIKATGALIR